MISTEHPLCLGSASPRRRQLLEALGLAIRIAHPSVDEQVDAAETAESYLKRVVDDKLCSVAGAASACASCAALLVADTIVVIDGRILGKPADVDAAVALLRDLVGREHWVYTRYAIAACGNFHQPVATRTVSTRVKMRGASAEELERYARTGEGLDKAGAYAAQGIGAFLVEGIIGSYTNVIGLPVCEVVLDLVEAGVLEAFPG